MNWALIGWLSQAAEYQPISNLKLEVDLISNLKLELDLSSNLKLELDLSSNLKKALMGAAPINTKLIRLFNSKGM